MNTRRARWGVLLLGAAIVALALLGVIAVAQNRPEGPPAAESFPDPVSEDDPGDEPQEPVYCQARSARWDGENETWYLTGEVHMQQPFTREEDDGEKVRGKRVVLADEAIYNEATNRAEAVGHLQIREPDATITGEKLEAFFDDEYMIISGNVEVQTKKRLNPDLLDEAPTALARVPRGAPRPAEAAEAGPSGADGPTEPDATAVAGDDPATSTGVEHRGVLVEPPKEGAPAPEGANEQGDAAEPKGDEDPTPDAEAPTPQAESTTPAEAADEEADRPTHEDRGQEFFDQNLIILKCDQVRYEYADDIDHIVTEGESRPEIVTEPDDPEGDQWTGVADNIEFWSEKDGRTSLTILTGDVHLESNHDEFVDVQYAEMWQEQTENGEWIDKMNVPADRQGEQRIHIRINVERRRQQREADDELDDMPPPTAQSPGPPADEAGPQEPPEKPAEDRVRSQSRAGKAEAGRGNDTAPEKPVPTVEPTPDEDEAPPENGP